MVKNGSNKMQLSWQIPRDKYTVKKNPSILGKHSSHQSMAALHIIGLTVELKDLY